MTAAYALTTTDVDLRKLRYFLAVAEQLNFTRAAEALHIAQPVLSRQIRSLEAELNAQLFVRDRRRTELTPAGEQLVADATELLASARALRRRVARAAHGPGSFVVGFMPGLTVTAPLRALADAHPDLTVDVLRTGWTDQTAVLHDGRVDVSYVRLPIDDRGIQLRPLFREPRVAVLPTDHPLAAATELRITDLRDEHLLQHPDAVPEWRAIAPLARRRAALHAATSATYTVEEKLEHVAAGRGICVLPHSTATYYRRPDVVTVALADTPPTEICLAWLAVRRSPLIVEFVELAIAAEPRRVTLELASL